MSCHHCVLTLGDKCENKIIQLRVSAVIKIHTVWIPKEGNGWYQWEYGKKIIKNMTYELQHEEWMVR